MSTARADECDRCEGAAVNVCGRWDIDSILKCVLLAGHVCLTVWFGREDYMFSIGGYHGLRRLNCEFACRTATMNGNRGAA